MSSWRDKMELLGVTHKDCPGCGEYKHFDDFTPITNPASRTKMASWCRDCQAAQKREHFSHQENKERRTRLNKYLVLLHTAKRRALKLDLPYDLLDHREAVRARIDNGVCELTGLPFSFEWNKRTFDSPSIDRIKPELGYVYTNIRVILWGMNAAIGNWGEDVLRDRMARWLEK